MHVFAAGDKPGRAVQCVPDAPHHDTKRSRAPQTQDRCGLRRFGSGDHCGHALHCQNRVNFGYTQVVHVECHCTRT
jgi:hypothetical protein